MAVAAVRRAEEGCDEAVDDLMREQLEERHADRDGDDHMDGEGGAGAEPDRDRPTPRREDE
jgi:hypothetical protein